MREPSRWMMDRGWRKLSVGRLMCDGESDGLGINTGYIPRVSEVEFDCDFVGFAFCGLKGRAEQDFPEKAKLQLQVLDCRWLRNLSITELKPKVSAFDLTGGFHFNPFFEFIESSHLSTPFSSSPSSRSNLCRQPATTQFQILVFASSVLF
ncbi:hypothetical protein D8674_015409 [Pyrus ussuriensis x Pyrus communis]|uniref:Uncharacterized protein n=1 Tax=Pyrus ussuriensis x Pyrus communis TaxID=2448454 RepID=A0A5N5H2J0_9ROSA|nr:hypothetical protein D8674_015409 [Pyrus ussuriensis x Pyrus communis]